jgi:hypothetical protein
MDEYDKDENESVDCNNELGHDWKADLDTKHEKQDVVDRQ